MVLYEYGTVEVDGVWIGDLYNGQNNANSVNSFTLNTGALAELAADGELEVTLTLYATVSNPCGLSLSNTPETLVDATLTGDFEVNEAPVAAGHAEDADADDSCIAAVTLVSDSTDANDDIVTTDWDFDQDGTWDAWGDSVEHDFAIGTHTVDLRVEDSWGESSTASVTFRVVETAAEYTPVLSKTTLWPPDHSHHAVSYSVDGTYVCSGDAVDSADIDWALIGVTSDEADDAPGGSDGHTTNDIVYKPNDTVFLRAERDTKLDGREYSFEFRVYDEDGNVKDTLTDVVDVPLHLGCGGCASGSPAGGAFLIGLFGLVALRRREQ